MPEKFWVGGQELSIEIFETSVLRSVHMGMLFHMVFGGASCAVRKVEKSAAFDHR